MFNEILKPLQRVGLGRCRLSCEARHPHHPHHNSRSLHPHNKQHTKKKRDISTSFRKGPVPRPLVNTQKQLAKEDEQILGIPPPANVFQSFDLTDLTAASFAREIPPAQPWQGGYNDLAEPAWTSNSRADSEPVIAVAAVNTPDLLQQDLLLSMDGVGPSPESQDDLLWPEADQDADPLATLDRVLGSLLVAPPPPQPLKRHKSSNNKSSPGAHDTNTNLTPLSSAALHPQTTDATCSSRAQATSSSRGMKAVSSGLNVTANTTTNTTVSPGRSSKSLGRARVQSAAAAAPAVTTIRCETEYERELQAAAALQQLLVVKVESSHHLLQGAQDSSLRFQTHTNLPTQLNAYLPHTDMPHTHRFSSSSTSSTSSTAEVLASMGVPLGLPASSPPSGTPQSGLFGQSSSSSNTEPFTPVHAWYKQLAARYAHSAAAGRVSPVRFLSLQCEGGSARSRSVCRRLGVSAPLAVVLVDPTSERKLQEVCGAKIELELPYGLMYFGGVDQQGLVPSEHLQPLNTAADLQALRSSTPWSVAVFHVHAAPPCVRSYGRLHALTQQLSSTAAAGTPAVSFGVMDVDSCPEGQDVSRDLNLQQLPTYIIYKDGQEVTRLTSSPDRRRLPEVLAQHMAAAAAAASVV